jgi:hypothetical protein
MTELTKALAEKFALIALNHVSREFPNKLDHVMDGPSDVLAPRALHPIFFGSCDWHSCVHGYWLLARLRRRFPSLESADQIDALFEERFTEANCTKETEYALRSSSRGFERPYGWAWALALQAELDQHKAGTTKHAARAMESLSSTFAQRFADFLPISSYPVRTGVHTSTAFALRISLQYAQTRDHNLFELMCEKVTAWYSNDRDAQAWEPSQDDFLSPALMEAECMRAVLDPIQFNTWFDNFLPRMVEKQPATLFVPAQPTDRTDGKIAHLDGLNLSRAWCWRSIATSFEAGSIQQTISLEAAQTHIDASLGHVAGHYMGEHWLATFAVMALDQV